MTIDLTSLQKIKLKLFAEGMAISEKARRQLSETFPGGALTMADYASTSGIPMRLPDDIWVNAPIHEYNSNFISNTRNQLDWTGQEYVLHSPLGSWPVEPITIPAFAIENNSQGEPYIHFGLTHTDRVRISPISGCANNCAFCDLPRRFEYRAKETTLLMETIHTALTDPVLPAKHILISGGTPYDKDTQYLRNLYEEVLAGFPGIPVDIMMLPLQKLFDLKDLKQQGLNGLSINLELFNDKYRKRLMPEKHAIPKPEWFTFIEQSVEIFGTEVRSMLMVGLEPLESTLSGVRALAERGCTPVLSPFRPAPGTPLEATPAPTAEYLEEAFLRARDICDKFGMKLGPQCIPCQHNTISFADGSAFFRN